MSAPPTTGPRHGPEKLLNAEDSHHAADRVAGPAARVSSVMPTGTIMPPPIPWRTRKKIRLLEGPGGA